MSASSLGQAAPGKRLDVLTVRRKRVGDIILILQQNRGGKHLMFLENKLAITDLADEKELLAMLAAHDRVRVHGQVYAYAPRHPEITNKQTLTSFLDGQRLGVLWSEIADSYLGLDQDVYALEAQGVLHRFDPNPRFPGKDSVVMRTFPLPMGFSLTRPLHADFKKLWDNVRMPEIQEVEAELRKHKLMDINDRGSRGKNYVEFQQGPAKKRRTIKNVSNAHLKNAPEYSWMFADQDKKK
jgi:hypothetical protein